AEVDDLPRSTAAARVLILKLERCRNERGIRCAPGKVYSAGSGNVGLHQELRTLCVDHQAKLRIPRLCTIWAARTVESLCCKPEFAVLFRAEAKAGIFRPSLIVQMPSLATIP